MGIKEYKLVGAEYFDAGILGMESATDLISSILFEGKLPDSLAELTEMFPLVDFETNEGLDMRSDEEATQQMIDQLQARMNRPVPEGQTPKALSIDMAIWYLFNEWRMKASRTINQDFAKAVSSEEEFLTALQGAIANESTSQPHDTRKNAVLAQTIKEYGGKLAPPSAI